MRINQIKKIDPEIFSALHYNNLEEAGAEMLYLAACTKLSEYMSEEVFYEAKYELCFEEFKNKYNKKKEEENFEEEDDYLAWQFAYENTLFWKEKVEELKKCC